MSIPLRQSTDSQEITLGVFLDDTDGKTPETGLTIANTDIQVWKHGATTLANKTSGGGTHIAGGVYSAVLDATDTNTPGSLAIYCQVAGALPVKTECVVFPAKIYDSLFGSDNLEIDVVLVAGAAVTGVNDFKADVTNLDAAVSTRLAAASYAAPLDAAGVRTAVGMATANLDTQLADIPTVLEMEARTILAASYFDPAADVVAHVTLVDTTTINTDMRGTDGALTAVAYTTPLDAAGTRTAIGLASANLDTQLSDVPTVSEMNARTLPSANYATAAALDAVDNFVDTEIGLIKGVTDKLDTALELDGAVYRLTTNALELAPTGGDVPSAADIRTEMDNNSTKLASILADTNELQTDWVNGGRLDLILDSVSGAATGVNAVTLTVDDGTNPIADVAVAIYDSTNAVLVTSGVTNVSGVVVVYLNDGSYKVRLRKVGASFTSPESLAVLGDTVDTYTGMAVSLGIPADSDACRVYEYCYTQDGATPLPAVSGKAVIVTLPYDYDDKLHSASEVKGAYNATTGLLYWDIVKGATVRFTIDKIGVSDAAVIPNLATARLADILL